MAVRKIEADQVVLAVGHSARDTFEKLLEKDYHGAKAVCCRCARGASAVND